MIDECILRGGKGNNFATNDNKIFILGRFSDEETNEMIGHLACMVYSMKPCNMYSMPATITNPYDLGDSDRPVIDVYINSPGGSGEILHSISTLLSIAKSRGALVRTTVLGIAASCGSLLAIQGTPGFRIMYSKAYHFVHFGRHGLSARTQEEVNMMAMHITEYTTETLKLYTDHTKLTQRDLDRLTKNECGHLNANECLQYGLCDWVIDDFGKLKQRIANAKKSKQK